MHCCCCAHALPRSYISYVDAGGGNQHVPAPHHSVCHFRNQVYVQENACCLGYVSDTGILHVGLLLLWYLKQKIVICKLDLCSPSGQEMARHLHIWVS